MRIELTRPAWKAGVLPLNYTRSIKERHNLVRCEGCVKREPLIFIVAWKAANTKSGDERSSRVYYRPVWYAAFLAHRVQVAAYAYSLDLQFPLVFLVLCIKTLKMWRIWHRKKRRQLGFFQPVGWHRVILALFMRTQSSRWRWILVRGRGVFFWRVRVVFWSEIFWVSSAS